LLFFNRGFNIDGDRPVINNYRILDTFLVEKICIFLTKSILLNTCDLDQIRDHQRRFPFENKPTLATPTSHY
jgi:hypothetical protein